MNKENKSESENLENESFSDTPEAVCLPKDNWDIIRQYRDKDGNVDIEKAKDALPELKKGLVGTLREKQKMIVESISSNDITGAGLRDKAMSSKALHDQAAEMEQGRPMGNIQVFYIKAK